MAQPGTTGCVEGIIRGHPDLAVIGTINRWPLGEGQLAFLPGSMSVPLLPLPLTRFLRDHPVMNSWGLARWRLSCRAWAADSADMWLGRLELRPREGHFFCVVNTGEQQNSPWIQRLIVGLPPCLAEKPHASMHT